MFVKHIEQSWHIENSMSVHSINGIVICFLHKLEKFFTIIVTKK